MMAAAKNKVFSLDEFQKKVLTYVANGENLFVTGKAGTGKTALLREITKMYAGRKVIAVLAPTGVAAKNAEGFTMHSFLRLPLKPYLPEHKVKPDLYQLKESGAETLRSVDIIIIDEISMVRCDMLDAADAILQHYRNNDRPFGGVQLIMFGDLYQLCPVAAGDDIKVLKGGYDSNEFYFFISKALRNLSYRVIELKKIHRQDNRKFINLLNNVRIGEIDTECLSMLESRVERAFKPSPKDDILTLMTHNYQTRKRNKDMYEMLRTKEHPYTASIVSITDRWYEKYPVDYRLKLKVGSRVMFQRNDKENDIVNGTMGWVKKLYGDDIYVELDNGREVKVEKAVWQQFDYFVDKQTKTIYSTVSAEFHQYPLKLAWAVSIHKSQGLTLKEVNIDASKAFAFGQVYVALSRCTTLEGIHLLNKIPAHKIIADEVVKQYMESVDNEGYVTLPDEFGDADYENEPLVLNVRSNVFDNIANGVKKKYGHTISDKEYAKKLLVHNEDGSYRLNKLWADKRKRIYHYRDMNAGHFPFILRKYHTVMFIDRTYGRQLEVEIDGNIEPDIYTDDLDESYWKFMFRLGKIIKRKRKIR